MGTGDEAVVYLDIVVAAMRRLGVSEYAGIKLGPPPSDGADDNATQRDDAAKVEMRAREERRRIALASSGGPLKRVEQF